MDLKSYFENTSGTGIISTADSDGNVDCAIYARPHVMEDGTIALIMRDRLSHKNLQSNPKAAYMFIEKGAGYKGKRLYLTKVREDKDKERIESLKRRSYPQDHPPTEEERFLVYFQLDKELPLVGSGGK
ncbi:MAG: pyridoxamine 5'-phosphate oxidase family protein [Desulfobacterales bacterium]|nr:pyridoxamine 5'-phosphate oxidase family protein [Desulfobacterales bacterium]